ncbi:MAG: DNA alkylation repair protein [Sporichthyaceae bacterium]|nr:DNA alkylation repair protein [Sporichthyaceae bacterium]
MTDPDPRLIQAVRAGLAAAADPAKAPTMQAYMKSELPFYGTQAPDQRQLFRAVFAAHPLPDRDRWLATIRALWEDAIHREERYAAIALTGARPYAGWQTADLVPGLYHDMIVTGAWWDYVDDLAIRRVGPIVRAEPEVITPIMLDWSAGDDLWLRRSAIICQIASKAATDTELLTLTIERAIEEREFFLRKAIGWALREHAKTDPDWVRRFVAARVDRLSGLSKREALRRLDQPPSGSSGP